MEIKSNLSPRDYTEKEVCRIINPLQAKMHIKNRVYPIDIYTSFDMNGNDIIVYIFLRKDTQDVYKKWINYELK